MDNTIKLILVGLGGVVIGALSTLGVIRVVNNNAEKALLEAVAKESELKKVEGKTK